MNAIATPAAELQAEFLTLVEAAARRHAGQFEIRIEAGRAVAVIGVDGQGETLAEWPADHCRALLPAAFALIDGAVGAYEYGSFRSGLMTGARAPLPAGVATVFLQFFAAREGARHLVARITREGDVCCGTCGG